MTHCCVCNESDCKPRCSLTWCESHTQGRIKLGLLKPKTVAEAHKVWSQVPEGVRLSPALNGVGIPVYEGLRSVQEAQHADQYARMRYALDQQAREEQRGPYGSAAGTQNLSHQLGALASAISHQAGIRNDRFGR